jgi:putative membrane protein
VSATASTSALPPRLSFLDARAKARAVEAVRAFEAHTCAELVVVVRRTAKSYPEAHLTVGAVAAFAALVFLLLSPVTFDHRLMPFDTALAYACGVFASRYVPAIGRLGSRARRRREALEAAAKVAFVDLGISRTKGRTGILVFVGAFEEDVAIVCDVGVSGDVVDAMTAARPALASAVARGDVAAFGATLEALGPKCAASMSRAHDDVNELPDEVG